MQCPSAQSAARNRDGTTLRRVPKPQRAAIYTRISDARDNDDGGVVRQETDCRRHAERLGWTIAEVYIENDTSAFQRRKVTLPDGRRALRVVRPEFRRLLDDLDTGHRDALIAYDLDRACRDPRDLEDLVDVVEQQARPVESVTGSLRLATDADVTMARVMVAMANKASRDTARRVKRKHEELAAAGKWAGGGIRPYGYADDRVTVDEDEAAVLREIAARIIAGNALKAIVRDLNDRAVPTVRGGPWTDRSVKATVTKPRIAGYRSRRKGIVGDAQWEPILDRDTWHEICQILAARASGSTNGLTYWLTGILVCGRCGHRLRGSTTGKPNAQRRYWCDPARKGCGRIAITAEPTHRLIGRLIVRKVADKRTWARLRDTAPDPATEALRLEMAADERQLRELARAHGNRQIPLAEWIEARKPIEARLRAARRKVVRPPKLLRDLAGPDVAARWEAFTPEQKRIAARGLLAAVTVQPHDPAAGWVFDPHRLKVGWR
jgi:DNA invertase Pin-like site-specific DNA recombinase